MTDENGVTGFEIAVIGMAGRFPGAKKITEFWNNIKNGMESVSFFSDEELKATGVEPVLLESSNFVKAKPVLEDFEYFDSSFFGYTPIEAEMMDPQMRIFHEIAWEALEDAGYTTQTPRPLIGLYAGAGVNHYWEALCTFSNKGSEVVPWTSVQLIDKDYFTLRIAYALNLTGPSIPIFTACSTSLVAIHLACQAILNGECDLALAGGVTILLPNKSGYTHQEGMILSPDGHCRPFDALAKGTIGGSGAGIVVLKLLEDAAADRDNIYAVIKGSAINNDGMRKGGFTAPAIDGQVDVIRTAHQAAHVEPESIGLIEAHGTATALGDPIEIEALKLAFNSDKKGFCALGSLKSNLGHIDTAAGVAGFIKAVMALKYKLVPPTINFDTPNSQIDFIASPFYVNTRLSEWENGRYPLRAGISAFGIGGTNAHVVLEEFPQGTGGLAPLPDLHPSREYQLILLSAKTQTALDQMTQNLAEYFKKNLLNQGNHENPTNPGPTMADAAYTLQVGRRYFKHRRMLVCSNNDVKETINLLSTPDSEKVNTFLAREDDHPIVFMFPGLGSQYVNMGRELYQKEPIFQQEMDRCFKILKPLMEFDIKEILYPSLMPGKASQSPGYDINHAEIAQLIIFIFEYALARLLMKWGLNPDAMVGYSFGEYTAACIAGVFSLEDALKLTKDRGKLIAKTQEGAMLNVPLSKEELKPLLPPQLSLAIDNETSCLVSGPKEAVDIFEKQMKERILLCLRLNTTIAAHSSVLTPILGEFKERMRGVKLNTPLIPYISNVTGTWITADQAVDPEYWSIHMRNTVRFADGIKELLENHKNAIFLEIGPGLDLTALVRRYIEDDPMQRLINLIKSAQTQASDVYHLLSKLGQIWLYGKQPDWQEFYSGEKRKRVPLPTYSFDAQYYSCEFSGDPLAVPMKSSSRESSLNKKNNPADWFYQLSWKRMKRVAAVGKNKAHRQCQWLIFIADDQNTPGLCSRLVKRLKQHYDHDIITAAAGETFMKVEGQSYRINPENPGDYITLLNQLPSSSLKGIPLKILHLWNVACPTENQVNGEGQVIEVVEVEKAQELGFYSLLYLAQAIGKLDFIEECEITVLANNMHEVMGETYLCPEKMTLLGPIKSIPQESPRISCRSLDIILPPPDSREEEQLVDQLLEEAMASPSDTIVAFRANHRWVCSFEPSPLEDTGEESPRLRQEGVYLITGGLGNVGIILAENLFKSVGAKLVLAARTPLPPRDQWPMWLDTHKNNPEDKLSQRIREVQTLENQGAEVLVLKADVADEEQMRAAIARAEERFGSINGVIHAAGDRDTSTITPIGQTDKKMCRREFLPKINGAIVLAKVLKDKNIDFCLVMSSISSVLAGIGFIAYAAANLFMDAFILHYNRFHSQRWISVNWDGWLPKGVNARELEARLTGVGAALVRLSMTPTQGFNAFKRVLAQDGLTQVVISTGDLQTRFDQWIKLESLKKEENREESSRYSQPRPNLSTPYAAPQNHLQEAIANIFQKIFGFEKFGIHDDFLELGGDSLKMITVISLIHKHLNVQIPLPVFFSNPTIAGLAKFIESTTTSQYAAVTPLEKREYYPLSPAQKRLYFIHLLAPESTAYNEPDIFTLVGEIDKNRLEKTFKQLIQRHESFRTSYVMIGDEPVQRIHDTVDFAMEYYTAEPGEKANEIVKNFFKPFNLSQVPLLRAGLLKPGSFPPILMVDMHHIETDGVSIQIQRKDFMSLYADLELPSLKLQYKDFSGWQNRQLKSGEIKKQEEYWVNRFKGYIPVLELPTDYPPPSDTITPEGGSIDFIIDGQLSVDLRRALRETGTTMFMFLLTVYYILLAKYSSQEDIVVGSPVAGRRHDDLKDIIGMFVNMLSLRNHPAKDKTFKQFLEEVKINAIDAYDNQDYQFDELVSKLGLQGTSTQNPMFRAVFGVVDMEPPAESELEDGEAGETEEKPFEYQKLIPKYDLRLAMSDLDSKVFLCLQYSKSIFKDTSAEKMTKRYMEILEQVLKKPDILLKDITLSHELLITKATTLEQYEEGFEF